MPKPGANQVVIKVVVTGTNPKDWKVPEWMPDKIVNQGDDIAGEVHAVGGNVTEFKVPSLTNVTGNMRFDSNFFKSFSAANLTEVKDGKKPK